MPRISRVWLWVASVILLACSGVRPPVVPDSPALPSGFHAEPLPSENDSALGRVIDAPLAPGDAILQVSRANPCSSYLEKPKDSTQVGELEGTQDVSADASGHALLGKYGFHAAGSGATSLVVRLKMTNQLSVIETEGYGACCRTKGGCGIGYVSTLVHGSGEYAATKVLAGEATADFVVTRGEASVRLKAIERKRVSGYIAAAVTPTDFQPAAAPVQEVAPPVAEPEDPRVLRAARSQQDEAYCAYNSNAGVIRCQFATAEDCVGWVGNLGALVWDCVPRPDKIWCRLDTNEQLDCFHYAAECDKRRVTSCTSSRESDADQCAPESCRKLNPATL